MARFTRKINKENKTVTVTDTQTGNSRSERYHDSRPAEEAARDLETTLAMEDTGSWNTKGEERQSALNKEGMRSQVGDGFLSQQRMQKALQAGSSGDSPMQFRKNPVTPQSSSNLPDGGGFKEPPMINQSLFGPVNVDNEPVQPAKGLARDRNVYTPEETPIQRRHNPMDSKGAYMDMLNQERAEEKALAGEDATQRGLMEKIINKDSFERGGRPIDYSEALTNLEGGDLKPKQSSSGLMEEALMADTSQNLMEESTISGDDPVTRLTEDIVQTSAQESQADIDAGLEAEDDRYAQAQKRSGVMNDPSQMRMPQSEDEAKYGQGAETIEQNFAGSDPALLEEQTINADDPPEVLEMKKVQEDPKARAELFKDMPPAMKAQAKEEFGDYYIDSSTGYAINLKSLRKSQKRREHMDTIKHFPESLRPAMLHKWGYLDGEDVPIDERLQLDQKKLGFEMTKYFAGLNENKRQFNESFGEGKRQFDATIGNKKYEFGESTAFKNRQQDLLNKQFGEGVRQFDAKLAETQKKNVITGLGEFLKNGQFEAATFYAKSNGLELPFSITDALRFQSAKKAKSSSGDPMTTALASGYSINMKDYWKSSDSTVEKLMSPREDQGSGDSYFDAGMRLINAVPYKELPEAERSEISEADYNAKNFTAVKNIYMTRKYPGFHKEFMELQMLKNITRQRKQKGEDTPELIQTTTDTNNQTQDVTSEVEKQSGKKLTNKQIQDGEKAIKDDERPPDHKPMAQLYYDIYRTIAPKGSLGEYLFE